MPPKEVQPSGSVTLPVYPKYDEKDRKKWVQEYDKVEAELLRAHLAAPGQPSAVLSLRNADWSFDKHIPAPGDPTLSEQNEMLRKNGKRPGALQKLPPRAQSTDPSHMSSIAHVPADVTVASGGGGRQISPLRKRPTSAKLPASIVAVLPMACGAAQHRSLSPIDTSTGIGSSLADGSSVTMMEQTALSATEMAKIARYLLNPPVDYKSSFHLNLKGIDLRWMQVFRSGDRVPDLFTLETLREDLFTNPALPGGPNSTAINSPRSAYVLLRNGLGVEDLQMRPHSYFVDRTGTADNIVTMRFNHFELRRKYLIQSLRAEYRLLCSSQPLYDILEEFLNGSEGAGVGKTDVTFLQNRRSRIEKVQQKNKQRLEKQMEYVADLQSRGITAEERRLAAEKELMMRREKLREENRSKMSMTAKRSEQLRASNETHAEQVLAEMMERQHRLEEKERQQQEAMEAKAQQKREAREKRAKQRQERQQANRELLDRKAHEEECLRQEREAAAREKQRQQQIREALERDDAERHKRVVELARQQARLRVEQQLEEATAKARQRDAESIKRLQEFEESRRQQREAIRQAEALKESKRQQAFRDAQRASEEHKETILRKRETLEQKFHNSMLSKKHEDETVHEVSHIGGGDKLFFVNRRANAQEFGKLVSICKIVSKKETAEAISRQREALLNATLRDREALRLDKERAQKELEKRMRSMSPVKRPL
jgi:hypothetical protein